MNVWNWIKTGVLGILAFGLGGIVAQVNAAELTTSEAARLLNPSVFSFGTTSGSFCTATKIGPTQYLTALHCAKSLDMSWRLESSTGEYVFVRSVLASVSEKSGGGKWREDWAILNGTSLNKAPSLPLGCGDTLHVGEPVAYLGFPEGLTRAFGKGYISTLEEGSRNNADFFIDLPVAPGASGSAVISLETGHIIGVLTEGVLTRRTTEFYMTGVESIEHVDTCKDWSQTMKEWEAVLEDDFDIIEEVEEAPKDTYPVKGSKSGDDHADVT
jgi:hypothetical protein